MPLRTDDEGLPEDPVFSNYSGSLWKSHSERRGRAAGGNVPVEPLPKEQAESLVKAALPPTVAGITAKPSAKSEI
jgi:hypothetical protein